MLPEIADFLRPGPLPAVTGGGAAWKKGAGRRIGRRGGPPGGVGSRAVGPRTRPADAEQPAGCEPGGSEVRLHLRPQLRWPVLPERPAVAVARRDRANPDEPGEVPPAPPARGPAGHREVGLPGQAPQVRDADAARGRRLVRLLPPGL